jgi:chromosome condensin MukBEF complex kleisin-like MukF subunit
MNQEDRQALREVGEQLEAAKARLGAMVGASQEESWTLADLRHELDRWEQKLRSATNDRGQPYSQDTISTHIGHSRQFIRWLAGEWQPTGSRIRP